MYTVSRQKKYIADLFILIPNRIAGIYINPRVEGLNIPLYVKFKGKFMKTIFKCQKKRTVTLRHKILGCVRACSERVRLNTFQYMYKHSVLVCVCVKIFRKLAKGFCRVLCYLMLIEKKGVCCRCYIKEGNYQPPELI